MENKIAKTKKKIYKRWWFWLIIVWASVTIFATSMSLLNKNIENKNYELIINSSYQTQTVGENQYLTESTNEMFVVVNFTLKNNTSSDLIVYSNDVKLKVKNSNYTYHTGATLVAGDPILAKTIGAGITINLTIVFEVPYSSSNETMQLTFKSISTILTN